MDYATNKNCSNHYNDGYAGWWRTDNREAPLTDLVRGSTISVGLDYYALMGVCEGMVPVSILEQIGSDLIQGKVFIFDVWLEGEVIYWKERKE